MAARRNRRDPLVIRLDLVNSRATLRALSELGPAASAEIRRVSREIAVDMARAIERAGQNRGGQAALLAAAGAVRVKSDRVPAVEVGANPERAIGHVFAGAGQRGGRGRPGTVRDLLFGSEFGANPSSGRYAPYGYEAHAGRRGLWIFPTVEGMQGEINRRWQEGADRIAREFRIPPTPDAGA